MKSAIQSLDVSYLLHATEDEEKVAAAVRSLIGLDVPLQSEKMEGHFGNPICKVSVSLHGDDALRSFESISAKIPGPMREEVSRGIDGAVDEHGSLYMRFDKQKLLEGQLATGTNDVVRLKLKPRAFMLHGRAREFFLSQLKAR